MSGGTDQNIKMEKKAIPIPERFLGRRTRSEAHRHKYSIYFFGELCATVAPAIPHRITISSRKTIPCAEILATVELNVLVMKCMKLLASII